MQNGQEILDSLSELKPTLVDRHERWVARYGADDLPHPSPGRSTPGHRRPRYDDPHSPAREAEHHHQRARAESMRYHEEQQRLEALREEARRRQYEYDHHDDYADHREDERHREFLRREEEQHVEANRRSMDVARRAALGTGSQDGHTYGTPPSSAGSASNMLMTMEAQRRQQEFERQQAEMKRREEEIIRNKRQAEIIRRQQEAEEAAHIARHTPTPSPGHMSVPQGLSRQATAPSHIAQFPGQYLPVNDIPQIMPLESPKGTEDDYATDRETGPDAPWRPSRTQPLGPPSRQPARTCVSP